MNWYYTKEGQQLGPVSDYRMREFAAAKEIAPETLIWEKGMAEWRQAQDLRPDWFEVQPEPELLVEKSVVSPPPLPPQKPAAKRLLARLFAKVFDLVLVYVVLVLVLSPELQQLNVPQDLESMSKKLAEDEAFRDQMVAFQTQFAVYFFAGMLVLQVVGLTLFGATPGKFLVGLRVRLQNGQKLNFTTSLIRAGSDLVNYLLCGGFSYLWILIDAKGYGLHDRMSKTQVLFKSELPES